MDYERFFTEDEVATYKRVKRGSMALARIVREVVCEMTDGHLQRSGHEYVVTPQGKWRFAMRSNSDNTTESASHWRAHANVIVADSDAEMRAFFALHGLRPETSLAIFHADVTARMRDRFGAR